MSDAPSGTEPAGTGTTEKLLNRDFLLLWQGQAVSQLGNQAFALAMMFWTMQATGSATLMGLLMMTSTLPGALLAPIGGAVADRYPRIRLIVLADTVGGLALLGLCAAFYLAGGGGVSAEGSSGLLLALLFAVSLLLGTLMALLNPTVAATIPDLVPPKHLAAANSLNQMVLQAAIFVGQGLGGLLYGWLGAPLLFALDGGSFLLAALSESRIRLRRGPRREAAKGGAEEAIEGATAPPTTSTGTSHILEPAVTTAWRSFFDEVMDGLSYVRRTPGVGGFLVAAASFNFFSAPLLVLLPFYVRDTLGREADWYGYLLAAVSLGAVVGFVLAGTVPLDGRRRAWAVTVFMLLAPGTLAALAVVRTPLPALATAFALGLMTGLISIQVVTILQSTTPEHLRGRVMGLMTALSAGLFPLGMGLGGVIGDLFDKNVPLIALGCGGATLLVTLPAILRPATQSFLAYEMKGPAPT